jgi:hypothetical protein
MNTTRSQFHELTDGSPVPEDGSAAEKLSDVQSDAATEEK